MNLRTYSSPEEEKIARIKARGSIDRQGEGKTKKRLVNRFFVEASHRIPWITLR
jgi:hypothetical protein